MCISCDLIVTNVYVLFCQFQAKGILRPQNLNPQADHTVIEEIQQLRNVELDRKNHALTEANSVLQQDAANYVLRQDELNSKIELLEQQKNAHNDEVRALCDAKAADEAKHERGMFHLKQEYESKIKAVEAAHQLTVRQLSEQLSERNTACSALEKTNARLMVQQVAFQADIIRLQRAVGAHPRVPQQPIFRKITEERPSVDLRQFTEPEMERMLRLSDKNAGTLGCLIFRSCISVHIYHVWAMTTNWDGKRGKYALPQSLRDYILHHVNSNFPCNTNKANEKSVRDKVNDYLRNVRTGDALV